MDSLNFILQKGKTEKLLKVSMRVDSKKMIIRDLVTHVSSGHISLE